MLSVGSISLYIASNKTKGLFQITFVNFKSVSNTLKARLKKINPFGKNIQSDFEGQKA
jgi:hypothetical protein